MGHPNRIEDINRNNTICRIRAVRNQKGAVVMLFLFVTVYVAFFMTLNLSPQYTIKSQ